jgi:hypothetical protein
MDERRRHALVEWIVAALVGAVLLLLARLLVPAAPAPPATSHGEHLAAMVAAPFAFDGKLPHRVLWPLLAHVAGWLGVGPVAFSQVCSGALLAVVCWFARQRGASWLGAALVAAAVAASGAVLVYQPLVCWSDQLVLLALVLLVHFAARPVVFWTIVLLASLAHEMVFFFAPWIVWLRLRAGGSLARDGTALAAALAAYAGWRWLVAALATDDPGRPGYGLRYYFEQNFWVPWAMPAMWLLWALVVVAEFGPLLALVVAGWRRGELAPAMGGRAGPWLYLACMASLMLLAYDVMRFAAFWMVPLVLAGVACARTARGRLVLAAFVAAAVPIYRWQHPNPAEAGGRVFTEVSADVLPLVGQHIEATRAPGADPSLIPHMGPGDAAWFTGELLGRNAVAFAMTALAWLAWIVLGRLTASVGLPRDVTPRDG